MTPAVLTQAPTGISWGSIPILNATPAQQETEQYRLCRRASSLIDGFCNQSLRCTVDTETLTGPGTWRVYVTDAGSLKFMVSRWPVMQVASCVVSPTGTFPPSWTVIPPTSLLVSDGLFNSEGIGIGSEKAGPFEVEIAPGYVDWSWGRMSARVQLTYLNGWPHTSLTAPALAGDTIIHVDDVTGFIYQNPTLYDAPNDEYISVTGITATTPIVVPVSGVQVAGGPGTLTLATPLADNHPIGSLVSTLNADIQWAAILLAAAQALSRGATAITVQTIRNVAQNSGSPGGVRDLITQAHEILEPFRRVVS